MTNYNANEAQISVFNTNKKWDCTSIIYLEYNLYLIVCSM